MPTPFNPSDHGFVVLRDYKLPGADKLTVHEFGNHSAVDGQADFLRLNLYLTKDGNYVTIWAGLLEPTFAEHELRDGRLKGVEMPEDFDFLGSYNQDLFRGYVDSAEAAAHVMTALRIGLPKHHYFPQVLRAGPDNNLRCEMLHQEIA